MHRFFVDKKITSDQFVIDDAEQVKQIFKVLRLSKGDRILVFDGSADEYKAEITGMTNEEIELNILEKNAGIGFEKKITLYQAILKKDNFEWVAQKATELGVARIVPVVSDRCIKREISEQGIHRLNQIIIEAAEQSGGAMIPELGPVMNFEGAIGGLDNMDLNIIAFEGEKNKNLSELDLSGKNISIFIGPEGGFTDAEIKSAEKYGIISVSLGKRILRAETAAIAALAKILL